MTRAPLIQQLINNFSINGTDEHLGQVILQLQRELGDKEINEYIDFALDMTSITRYFSRHLGRNIKFPN